MHHDSAVIREGKSSHMRCYNQCVVSHSRGFINLSVWHYCKVLIHTPANKIY